ncbi:hypothetical protein ACFXKY_08055 [Streptomyces canus]|uniref:hypothetical protein n=1 Tax=Streptomyces canus TaxID=58343 RepID=UPI0036BF328C
MSEPRLLTVDFVAERLTRGTARWVVHHVDQDGNGGGYVFPKETLEWRAAEYGLDDVDEILDMVLHEPHLPDEPDRDDAAARAGMVTSNRPDAEPITLFNATSSAEALAAHRLRIADAKKVRAVVRAPAKGKNPLDAIRAAHGITTTGLRTKREAVDVHRWHLVYGDLPVRPPSSSSLLEVPRA